ncbi:uncharacterized protein LOC123547115 isoform X2 [Mercenaria mercenaria]|uniref:uncharacterized protein LOC123547115 isoform X2 n=1 Tax=Mercenaria mercenaria TaxID=6596 RepID=UPI00234E3B87|nr:uncharacterized protein LOC123547115 isoform X2 [Mercenaria mercenaria]
MSSWVILLSRERSTMIYPFSFSTNYYKGVYEVLIMNGLPASVLLILFSAFTPTVSQFICNNKTHSWWEAMTQCRNSGGAPVSYREGIDKDMSDVCLDANAGAWTADFAVKVKKTDESDGLYHRVCGFTYLNSTNVKLDSWKELYGDCLERRNYFYENGTAGTLEILNDTFYGADISKLFRRSELLNVTQEMIPGFYWTGETAIILPGDLKSGDSLPSNTTYLCGVYGINTGHYYAFCSTHHTSLCYYGNSITSGVTEEAPGSRITSTAKEEAQGSSVTSLAKEEAPGDHGTCLISSLGFIVGLPVGTCLWIGRLMLIY